MPQEATKETLSFKSEDERFDALKKFEGDPPKTLSSDEEVNNWIREQEEEQKRVLEAEIVPEPEEAEPEPQVEAKAEPEPQVQEELPEPQVEEETQEEPQVQPEESVEEGLIQFSYKRDELPESLRVYKNPEEMIRQADHARRYANKAEQEMKEMAAEKERLAAELEEYKKQRELGVSKAPEVSEIPQPVAQTGDLAEQLKKIDSMEDSDYLAAGEIKNVFSLAVGEIAAAKKQIGELKNDLGSKLTNIEKANKEIAKKEEKARQLDAVARGINELQDSFPELKTTKPVSSIMGQSDCVERDVALFADRLLFDKFGNNKPTWQQRNVIINAYLSKDPEIRAYCQQNAITPESVGTTDDDMQKYATIMNVDANMRGEEIDRITGERKQKISPYTGQPINYGSYQAAYKDLKDTYGITQQEQKEKIAEAEILGQQSLSKAMEVRADTPKTLGNKGSTPPEVVKEMTMEAALKINHEFDDFKMETQALAGNRSLFHEYNKAQKVLGFPEVSPPLHWPPEK